MLNTSTLYKRLIKESGRTFRAEIITTFPDSSTVALTDKDIMLGSLVIKQGTSDEGSFSIGNAIIGELNFEIDNSSGTYDNKSFDGAVFDVRIGLVTEQKYDGTITIEWLRKGIYTAEEITVNEKYISIVAYDNLAKLDVPFADAGISFPCPLHQLYTNICTYCGVPYRLWVFPNSPYVVASGNDIDDETSCRDVLSFLAQLARCFVTCDSSGNVCLSWYKNTTYSNTTYSINEKQRLNSTVQITGIRLVKDDDETLIGTTGYCLSIEDNPLALNSSFLNHRAWNDLIGMQLTPFSIDAVSDPALEAGDIITIYDLSGNSYQTPVTNIIYRLDAKMTVSCDAETANENQRTRLSPSAKILARSKKQTAGQISEYDIRAKQFSQIAANAMGFFKTDEPQNDGSTITYLHDKPLLSDSQTIWKKTVAGFFVSTDGGQTYSAGIDSYGNAVLNMLAVKGIVADWIKAGILTDQSGITSIDLSNGIITIQMSSRNSLVIWANGITMKDSNDQVLTSMFVSQAGKGVITANFVYVGTRGSERTSIGVDNGTGYISTDTISGDTVNIGNITLEESGGKLQISSPVCAPVSLVTNGQEVGSFYINVNGEAVLNTKHILLNGDFYVPTNITVDGVSYTVLAKV